MPVDTTLNLLTDATLDEATDAPAGHAAVTGVPPGGTVVALVTLGVSAAATDGSDTLLVAVEASTDDGATWNTVATFRQFDGDDVPDSAAEAAGVGPRGFKAAKLIRLPRHDNVEGLLQLRATTDATIVTTGDFNCSIDIVTPGSVREEWYDNAA